MSLVIPKDTPAEALERFAGTIRKVASEFYAKMGALERLIDEDNFNPLEVGVALGRAIEGCRDTYHFWNARAGELDREADRLKGGAQ